MNTYAVGTSHAFALSRVSGNIGDVPHFSQQFTCERDAIQLLTLCLKFFKIHDICHITYIRTIELAKKNLTFSSLDV